MTFKKLCKSIINEGKKILYYVFRLLTSLWWRLWIKRMKLFREAYLFWWATKVTLNFLIKHKMYLSFMLVLREMRNALFFQVTKWG